MLKLNIQYIVVLLLILGIFPSCNSSSSTNPSLNDDVLGLIVFKADIKDPNGKLSSCNEDDDTPCNWFGILCNPRSNSVSELNFDGLSLTGKLGRGLLQLQSLRIDGLYNLRTINLSRNRHTGPIPNDIGGCSLLKSIDFSRNLLSGNLPITLLNLSFVGYSNMGENSFEGQIPEWIGGMRVLENLDLSANNFTGVLPTSVGKLRSLKVLNMSMNSLSGSLPESMADCASLQVIDFRQNMLSGDLPQWIFKVALQEILLSENKLGGAMED